jgi:hypothetical protein
MADAVQAGRRFPNVYAAVVAKYGEDEVRNIARRNGIASAGKSKGTGKHKSAEHRLKISLAMKGNKNAKCGDVT